MSELFERLDTNNAALIQWSDEFRQRYPRRNWPWRSWLGWAVVMLGQLHGEDDY